MPRRPDSPRWDGARPPTTIQHVWGFLGERMRELREKQRDAHDAFYDKQERLTYIGVVHDAVKFIHDQTGTQTTTDQTLHCLDDMEQLLSVDPRGSIRPQKTIKAQVTVRQFVQRAGKVTEKLKQHKKVFEEDVLTHLEAYCSCYMKLGIADDEFFKSLKARTITIRDVLRNFEQIEKALRHGGLIEVECFCLRNISQEVAMEYDCELYPVLRYVPDMLQKLEHVSEVAQDWLRSDKVYVEQVEREIRDTRRTIKEKATLSQQIKHEYDRHFAYLKQKKLERQDCDVSDDEMWKEMAKLEAKKVRLEMEITSVLKTLKNCRENIRDLSSVSSMPSDEDFDEVDDEAPFDEDEFTSTRSSNVHSSYKSRMCRDMRAHAVKLDFLRKKKNRIEKRITHKRAILADLTTNEADIQLVSKKLRSVGKRKSKILDDLRSLGSLLESLEQMLNHRLHPDINKRTATTRTRPHPRPDSKPHPRSTAVDRSTDKLHQAFKMVKNHIGHGWKDLVRQLPYEPAKDLCEVDNEICAVEYSNQGQLKEQAYQSLLHWHTHNGRRASIEVLNVTLRELNENRLADNIEREVMAPGKAEGGERDGEG